MQTYLNERNLSAAEDRSKNKVQRNRRHGGLELMCKNAASAYLHK